MTDTPGAGSLPVFWAPAGLVALVTFATFIPALSNPFVSWDDARNFVTNAHYRGLGRANLRWMFTSALDGHYVPITWLTFGLDYLLWGMNPRGYHLTSVILHVVDALLFYALSHRLLRVALGWPRSAPGLAWGAAAAALLFAVHPLRVESVAWITERRDVVAGALTLLTVLAYLEAADRGQSGHLRTGWYWTAVGLFGLALLSKSIVVGLPVVLLALDYYPLRRGPAGPRLFVEKIPFLLLSLAVAGLMIVIGLRREVLTSFEALGLPARLAVSAYSLAFYLWKTAIPWPLSPFYELHLATLPLGPTYLVAAAVVLAVSGFALAVRRRWPAVLAIWIAYCALLLPVSGLFHNGYQIVADRYSYLSCLGWALLGGSGVAWCWDAARRGWITPRVARLLFVLAGVVIAGLAGLTTLQIRAWRGSETLWRHAVASDPESAFAHFHLGQALENGGRADEARAEYERALALVPDRLPNAKAVFYATLGTMLHRQGDLAGAERSYRLALRYSEDNVLARTNLGVIQEQRGELEGALDSFVRVLRVLPGYPKACVNGRRLATQLAVSPKELQSCREGRERGERSAAVSSAR